MKYLFVKMRRDLMKMWTQFLSVFLMALIGVAIYSGMEGAWFGLQTATNKYYSDTNISSVWVYGKGITQDDVDKISQIDGVLDTNLSMSTKVKMKTNTENQPDIKLIATSNNTISVPLTIAGENFNSNDDGIWLDNTMANERKIKVGESITLTYGEVEKTFLVRGLILNPEFTYYTGSTTAYTPDHNLYGYAMISENEAKQFYGGVINNELRVLLSDDVSRKYFQQKSEEILSDRYFGFADRDSFVSVAGPLDKAKQIMKMSIMFSVVFILLALLTMQTTMTRLVENQRVQIGTLKALGFHKNQIMLHFALYGLSVGLLGGIGGLIIAPRIITPVLLNTIGSLYDLPDYSGKLTIFSFVVVIIVALCCTLATLFACSKSLEKMPAETLRGTAPKAGKSILIERVPAIWKHLSFGWKWSLRDIARNKIKTIMGIVGVFGCMMLLIASLGMENSMDYANNYVYKTEFTYGTKAILRQNTTQENRNELAKIVGESQWIQEIPTEIKVDGKEKLGLISIVDYGDFINLENLDNETIEFPQDGVFITKKIAEQFDLHAGDEFKFKVRGEKDYTSAIITEVVSAPTPQGLFISATQWEQMNKTFLPSSLLIKSHSIEEKIENLSYIQEIATIDNQLESAEKISETVSIIFFMLKIAALLLGVVILYNLGILSYTERTREYATLKVLGFYQKEIRSFALRENLFITIIGWIIGIPIGFSFLNQYVKTVSMDSFDWVAKLTPLSFVIASLITVGCSIGVSLLLTQKVQKINMVEALKTVE